MTTAETSPSLVEQKMGTAWAALGGMQNAAMMHVGGQLGLYKAMAMLGAFTASELGVRLNLAERFVREWLYQQAAAGIVESRGDGRFEFLPEAAEVFADSTFPLSIAKTLEFIPRMFENNVRSAEAFRTGIGRSYDDFGEVGARMIDALLGNWNRNALVSEALPKIPGVLTLLEQGAAVADVGCGAGAAPLAIARAFPRADVHGYDNSVHALAIAREEARAVGIANVSFHNPDEDPLPSTPTFDLVLTLDCLHDMTHPEVVASAIRAALKPDGVWFIVDFDGAPTAEGNITHPFGAALFAGSITTCLQTSVGDGSGRGLGTVGLPEPEMRKLASDAGFTRFSRVEGLTHPVNAYYQVRL